MLLNVPEAAERANVSESLIRRWTTLEKRLPHFRLGGRGKRGKLVIDSSDLDSFLDTLKVTGGERIIASPPPTLTPTFRHVRVKL